MKDLYFASAILLEKFRKNNCCSLIPENRRCKVMEFQNMQIIIITSCSSLANGTEWVTAFKVVPIDSYIGKVYTYNEHFEAVVSGTAERGYNGIQIKTQFGIMVAIGNSFTIKKAESKQSYQLTFFENINI